MKTKIINLALIILCVSFAVTMFLAGRGCRAGGVGGGKASGIEIRTRIDTVVVRDTIRDTVLVPVARHITRIDTVFVPVVAEGSESGATGDSIRAALPIEQKIYKTDGYRAVVEGFRPALVGMEVYGQTRRITRIETVKIPDRRRWGLGIQAGYGITTKGPVPYIGVGVQYNVIEW